MIDNPTNKIVAIVGLTGSGKSEAVKYIVEKGYPKVYFGGVILDAMTKAGLDLNEVNEQKFREEVRQQHGKDFVVKQIIEQIHSLFNAGQRRIVADGLYTWTEYRILKKEFPGELTVLAIIAPKKLRHHRLENRPIRPLTQPEADERDYSEIENLEKGGPIAIADYYIDNEQDLTHLHEQLDETLQKIDF